METEGEKRERAPLTLILSMNVSTVPSAPLSLKTSILLAGVMACLKRS